MDISLIIGMATPMFALNQCQTKTQWDSRVETGDVNEIIEILLSSPIKI